LSAFGLTSQSKIRFLDYLTLHPGPWTYDVLSTAMGCAPNHTRNMIAFLIKTGEIKSQNASTLGMYFTVGTGPDSQLNFTLDFSTLKKRNRDDCGF